MARLRCASAGVCVSLTLCLYASVRMRLGLSDRQCFSCMQNVKLSGCTSGSAGNRCFGSETTVGRLGAAQKKFRLEHLESQAPFFSLTGETLKKPFGSGTYPTMRFRSKASRLVEQGPGIHAPGGLATDTGLKNYLVGEAGGKGGKG